MALPTGSCPSWKFTTIYAKKLLQNKHLENKLISIKTMAGNSFVQFYVAR